MTRRAKRRDFAPKKLPLQQRSRETFDALVGACTLLLPERGYAGTTTNHIAARAGVNIASLYEYFPDKDAIVAQVAERLVERVLAHLAAGAPGVVAGRQQDAVRRWIELIYQTVARERALVAVFLYQVPFTNQLAPIQTIGDRLLEFSREVRDHAGVLVRGELSDARLWLLVNLVSSTIMQLVLDPPRSPGRRELLDELVRVTEEWLRRRRSSARNGPEEPA